MGIQHIIATLAQHAPSVIVAGGALFLFTLVVLLWLVLRKRTRRETTISPDLSIDLTALDVHDPPEDGPQLEYYGTPVRLVILVLAPAGRATQFPSKEELRGALQRLINNFPEIVDWHQPIYRQWPQQLSAQGFAQSFFTSMKLPGDRGKGTPWCSIAGRFSFDTGQLMAGLVCRAASSNGLGQLVVGHEGQWNDVMRIKR